MAICWARSAFGEGCHVDQPVSAFGGPVTIEGDDPADRRGENEREHHEGRDEAAAEGRPALLAAHSFGHRRSSRRSTVGTVSRASSSSLDDLVAEHLAPLDQPLRDPLDGVPVVLDQPVGGHERLPEELGDDHALEGVVEHPPMGLGLIADPEELERFISWLPIDSKRSMMRLRAVLLGLLVVEAAVEVYVRGTHPGAPDHHRRLGGGAPQVAADAGGGLPVEDLLGGHRPQRPDQRRGLLAAPLVEEALLGLQRLVVAEVSPRLRIDSRVESTSRL